MFSRSPRITRLFQSVRTLAGHSHYHNTRHRKAAVDASRQTTLNRVSRDVRVALSLHRNSPSPESSARLSRAVTNAKRAGLPKVRLNRLLNPVDTAGGKSGWFEGTIGGVGVLIRARVERDIVARVRSALVRAGGALSASGAFEEVFWISVIDARMVERAIELGVDDVDINDEGDVSMTCLGKDIWDKVWKGIVKDFGEECGERGKEWRVRAHVEVKDEKRDNINSLVEKLMGMDEVVDVMTNMEDKPEDEQG